ncbi:MAG: Rieske 2Fe-2S domain-containing protein, partial [Halobacteriales archaeon]|nr:Rieske 2Fe-2S domain-containing protein [Halobacteriales archaeon]
MSSYVNVASAERAREDSPIVVQAGGRSLGLFHHEGQFFATDNRCPHMGFPLTEGTVENGVLTCPWHHARFELSCGDTFDPFADDVRTYPVEIRDGDVYVDPNPGRDEPPEDHWRGRLEHGLEEAIDLVIAKSVIGLDEAGVPAAEPLAIGTSFGTRYRRDGWGRGLTTLGVMANLLDDLRPEMGIFAQSKIARELIDAQIALILVRPVTADAMRLEKSLERFLRRAHSGREERGEEKEELAAH